MTGTLTSVASLTICLAMTTTSAFVLQVPKISPPDPTWRKEGPAGGPHGVDGENVYAGDTRLFSWVSGCAGTDDRRRVLPRVPRAEGYMGVRSRSTYPLRALKGVEPDITQEGNATVPIRGDGDEEREDSGPQEGLQHDVFQDDEGLVQLHQRVSVTLDGLSSRFNLWGTGTRITGNALDDFELATTMREEGGGSTHLGVSTNADLAPDTDLESNDSMTDDAAVDAESLSDPADDGRIDGMSLETAEDAVDRKTGKSMPRDSDDNAVDEEIPFDLAAGDLIDELSFGPFGEFLTGYAAGGDTTSVLKDDLFDRAAPQASEAASKAVILDDRVNAMVRSVIDDALAGREDLGDAMFENDVMDDLLWSMIHDALAGRASSEPVNLDDTLEEMVTSMLDHAFFGAAASEARFPSHEENSARSDAGGSDFAPLYTPEMALGLYGGGSMPRVNDHNPSSAVEDDHEAGGANPDGEALVVRKARKRRWKWLRKIWGRVRRKRQ